MESSTTISEPSMAATGSSSSSQDASQSTIRSCSCCKRRISTAKFDAHSVCLDCRNVVCDLQVRCDECKTWSEEQMNDYIKHRKLLMSKSKSKKTNASSNTQKSTKKDFDQSSLVELENRLQFSVENMFSEVMDRIDDLASGLVSAPSQVPEPAPQTRSAGGERPVRGVIPSSGSQPPGAVPLSICSSPPHPRLTPSLFSNRLGNENLDSSTNTSPIPCAQRLGQSVVTTNINIRHDDFSIFDNLTYSNVSMSGDDVISPAPFSPSSLFFPANPKSFSRSRSSSSSFVPSSAQPFSSSSSSSSVRQPSSDFSDPNFNLAKYNAGVLGLSVKYQQLARAYFVSKLDFSVFKNAIFARYPDLHLDYAVDCSGGESVYWLSMQSEGAPESFAVSKPCPDASVSLPSVRPSFSTQAQVHSVQSPLPSPLSFPPSFPVSSTSNVSSAHSSRSYPFSQSHHPSFSASSSSSFFSNPGPSGFQSRNWSHSNARPSSYEDFTASDQDFGFDRRSRRRRDSDSSEDSDRDIDHELHRDKDKFSVKDYRRMMNFIVALFPQARGLDLGRKDYRSLFEDFFKSDDRLPPIPSLKWFARVQTAFEDADSRLDLLFETRRSDTSLLVPRKKLYSVAENPSRGKALPVNPSFEALLNRPVNSSRFMNFCLKDGQHLESALRNESEGLSHLMWVFTGLMALIKRDGYVPSDPSLFNQFVYSMSMGFSFQANSLASSISFVTKKRRETLLECLPRSYPDVARKDLLKSPVSSCSFLFPEEGVSALREAGRTSVSIKSQQALIDVARLSSRSRSRSPPRSPSRYVGRSGSYSPSRSPKKVRFNFSGNTSKSPPPPSKKGKDFQQ